VALPAHTGPADVFVQEPPFRAGRCEVWEGGPIRGMRPRSRAEHHGVVAKAEISGLSSDVSVLGQLQRIRGGLLFSEPVRNPRGFGGEDGGGSHSSDVEGITG
jgi:hypothetical protein